MVARTSQEETGEEGRGKRRRPDKPDATPDQSGENTQDMAYVNPSKSRDSVQRDVGPEFRRVQHGKRGNPRYRAPVQQAGRA